MEERFGKALELEVVENGFEFWFDGPEVEKGFEFEIAAGENLEPKMLSPSIGGGLGGIRSVDWGMPFDVSS